MVEIIRTGLRKLKNHRGFTITEMLIATIMVAILASMVIPRILNQNEKANAAEAINVLGAIARAENQYFDEHGFGIVFSFACGALQLTQDRIGIDLTAACANNRWNYDVKCNVIDAQGNGSACRAIATRQSPAGGTLFLRIDNDPTTNTAANTWGGTGTFAPGAVNWPNLQ